MKRSLTAVAGRGINKNKTRTYQPSFRPGNKESAAAMPDPDLSPAPALPDTTPVPVARLRAALELLARAGPGRDLSSLPFGLAEVDRVLGGGLLRGALHEVTPAAEGDATAAAGFSAALLARALAGGRKPALWVRHQFATLEDGAPYGPGLAAFGLDPARLLFVLAADKRELCEAMEQALRSGALAAVLGEVRGAARIDLRTSHRLSLAAARGGTPGVLLRLGASKKLLVAPVAAATRWRIKTLASGEAPANGLGAPRLEAELVRNRRGPAASFSLEWRTHDRTFLPVPALRERLAPAAVDRPHSAPASAKFRASA
jgi:protein ImuA